MLLRPYGAFPNNPELPVLIYRNAFPGDQGNDLTERIEATFARNGWTNSWRDTVYAYDHFHSKAHEVLGCYRGEAVVQLGGPSGPTITLSAGDVLVIPAGVSHKRIEGSHDFAVVGSYANGADWDMRRGDPKEFQDAQAEVRQVDRPTADPIYGSSGPLLQHWG
jgi:uncharacterized protein YjlB